MTELRLKPELQRLSYGSGMTERSKRREESGQLGRGVSEARLNLTATPVRPCWRKMGRGWPEPIQRTTGPAGTTRLPLESTMESSRGVRMKLTIWEALGARWMRWKPARARMGAPSTLGWEM